MDARDEKTIELSLAAAPVRRLRRISVVILAAIVVVVALLRYTDPVQGADLLTVAAALLAVGWAGYWVGVDRGLAALAAVDAGARLAARAPEEE